MGSILQQAEQCKQSMKHIPLLSWSSDTNCLIGILCGRLWVTNREQKWVCLTLRDNVEEAVQSPVCAWLMTPLLFPWHAGVFETNIRKAKPEQREMWFANAICLIFPIIYHLPGRYFLYPKMTEKCRNTNTNFFKQLSLITWIGFPILHLNLKLWGC